MRQRAVIAGLAAALLLAAALGIGALAGEIQTGATLEVKPNSIWFEDADKLAKWQQTRKSGDFKAFASYQDQILSEREAWQFINPLTVKVLGFEPGKNQVKVEMTTPGRLLGSTWFLDDEALR